MPVAEYNFAVLILLREKWRNNFHFCRKARQVHSFAFQEVPKLMKFCEAFAKHQSFLIFAKQQSLPVFLESSKFNKYSRNIRIFANHLSSSKF